jgi:response regulator RpfG family c-di-GMP phosphodiesterase
MFMEQCRKPDRIRVLYIDDDTDLVAIYHRFFENSDYDLSSAGSAEEGLEMAFDLLPDLIICDVILPGMNGLDFCRRVRNETSIGDVVLMLVTGMDLESGDIVEGFKAGADEYLMKPFSRDELFARINALLRPRRFSHDRATIDQGGAVLNGDLERFKRELDEARSYLAREKEALNGALRQVALMADERESSAREIQRLEGCLAQDRKTLLDLLARLIEAKPQYHRGHSTAVADMAASIARMMGLSDDQVEDIHGAARLHELGRLSIPEALSLKQPPDYSQAEKDLLALHPVNGSDMLRRFTGLDPVARIIRHIHEQVNGEGFPDGLAKDRIPLGSRVIAAVNMYDNLVNRACIMSAREALDTMDAQIGVVFDAGVMGALRRFVNRHVPAETDKAVELRLFEIKPGMTLAAGLYTAKGAKLLSENTVLTQDTINQLARYNKIDLLDETVFVKG